MDGKSVASDTERRGAVASSPRPPALKALFTTGLGFVGFGSCLEAGRSDVKGSYLALADITQGNRLAAGEAAVIVLSNDLRRSSAYAVAEKIFAITDELGILPKTTEIGVAISEAALSAAGLCIADLVKEGILLVYDMSAEEVGASEDAGGASAGGSAALFTPGAFSISKGVRAGVRTASPVYLRHGYCEAFDLYCEALECSRLFHEQELPELCLLIAEYAQRLDTRRSWVKTESIPICTGVFKGLSFGRFDDVFTDDDLVEMLFKRQGFPFGVKYRGNLTESYSAQKPPRGGDVPCFQTARVKAAREMIADFRNGYHFLGEGSFDSGNGCHRTKVNRFFSELEAFIEKNHGENFSPSDVARYVEVVGERIGLKALHEAHLQGVDWDDLKGVV